MKFLKIKSLSALLLAGLLITSFQNCASEVEFKSINMNSSSNTNGQGINCAYQNHIQPNSIITHKIDILIVTDTSGSLNAERGAVADGVHNFINELPSSSDYQIAVMAAHGSLSPLSGELYQHKDEAIVARSSELNKNDIQKIIKEKLLTAPSDSSSDGGEEGLYSLNKAITLKLNSHRDQHNFFREDAALAIIFIADENDICAQYPVGVTPVPDGDNKEGPAFIRDCEDQITALSVYQNLLAAQNESPLIVSAVIYTDPSTVPAGGENEVGYGYTDIVDLNAGLFVDIVAENIAQGLADIGELTTIKLNLIYDFKLNFDSVSDGNFNSDNISVLVDGNPVAFEYISALDSIHLDDAGDANSNIQINYCM